MSDQHPTCEDPSCAICQERVRQAALKIERGLRPAGRLQQVAAKIKAHARRLSKQGRA